MELPQWITEAFATYVLPYWPWIVAILIGAMIVRIALSRIINRVVGLVIGAVLVGGSVTTGASTWLSDRGFNLPTFGL